MHTPLAWLKRLVSGLLLVVAATIAAGADGRTAGAGDASAGMKATPIVTSHEFVIAGEVVARHELGFTVLSRGSELRTVVINRYTSIKKGAETIRLPDVRVGDTVTVTLRRAGDGQLQAVNVAVSTGYESRL